MTDAAGKEFDPMKEMDDALDKLDAGGRLMLPNAATGKGDKYAYDAEYMLDDQRGAMFLIYIEHLEKMKLRGMLVPERVATQDNSTGSYGMAQAHADMFITMVETAAGKRRNCPWRRLPRSGWRPPHGRRDAG